VRTQAFYASATAPAQYLKPTVLRPFNFHDVKQVGRRRPAPVMAPGTAPLVVLCC